MGDIRLPRNSKEGLLYGSIICIITVIVSLLLNIGTAFGRIDKEVLIIIIKMIPLLFVIAMALESLVIGKIAAKLVAKFTEPTDGFNTRILFNILFCVTGMSICMTIIGGMIGQGHLSLEPFKTFFSHWPRNFCVVLWCEILLAQPAARLVMKKLHQHQMKKRGE